MKTETIKDEFLNRLFSIEDVSAKMAEFYRKDWYYDVIKLNDDEYFAIHKPKIETNFCFGFGYCGVTTDEDMERAGSLAEKARTSQDRFISENLRPLNNEIATIKYHLLRMDNFEKAEEYYNKNNNLIQYADTMRVPVIYSCRDDRRFEFTLEYVDSDRVCGNIYIKRRATKDDLLKILSANENAREKFAKRLSTYLKKYGLTKLNVWTYLVD